MGELIYDEDGRPSDWLVKSVNSVYMERSRGSNDVGRRFTEVYGTEAAKPFLMHFADVVKTGKPRRFEAYFAPLDMHMLLSSFSLGGQRFGTLILDITERIKAEEALRDVAEKKDRFLAVLAHELRNPMAAINAAGAILSRPGIDEEKARIAREAL